MTLPARLLLVIASLLVLRPIDVSCFPQAPTIQLPKTALSPREVAVVVNDLDPQSVEIGNYYRLKRGIPEENIIHVRFLPGRSVLNRIVFERARRDALAQTPDHVQAYALTWTEPYRVERMSITTAFAAGWRKGFTSPIGKCTLTDRLPYYDSDSQAPFTDFGIRPTMALAGYDIEEVKRLIDRGIRSDETRPEGDGWLVDTFDDKRNIRARKYKSLVFDMRGVVRLEHVQADYIRDENNVLFYFTGVQYPRFVRSNIFAPGAVADHLTSYGGVLSGAQQMNILGWLSAGATGSYGTVVEPCNFAEKFPDPTVLVKRYVRGETLIEAYWKSVARPGEGVFVGEPLARPWGGSQAGFDGGDIVVSTHALPFGSYTVHAADAECAAEDAAAGSFEAGRGRTDFRIELAEGEPPAPCYVVRRR